MINIDLRRESPQDNVNRILALESLVKYYPLSVVEEIDKRCVQEWIEEVEGQDVTMKQIDMGFIVFGLPTPELKHLMHKVEQRMRIILEEQKAKLTPEQLKSIERGDTIDLIPEVKTSNLEEKPLVLTPTVFPKSREEREKERINQLAKEAEQRLQDHYNGIVVEDNERDEEAEKRWQESQEQNEAKIINLNTNQTGL